MIGRWTTGLTLAVGLVAPFCSSAQACDRPGNPVNLQSQILGSTSIRLSWANTDHKGSSDRYHMHFDISIHDQNGRPATDASNRPLDIVNGAYMANIKYMDRTSYDIFGLKPDTVYKISMRARADDGCVSEKASEEITVRTVTAKLDHDCNDYANKAIVAFQEQDSNHCSFLPPRWSNDRFGHLQFCFFAKPTDVQNETDGRTKDGYACVHHYNPFVHDFTDWLKTAGASNAQTSNGVNTTGYGAIKPQDSVPLASLSKAITGICIAKLVEAGTLAYTDKLSSHLGDYLKQHPPADSAAGDITIAQLLRHNSGLGVDSVQGYNASKIQNTDAADVEFARSSLANKLAAKNYFYNDVNYALLGMIIKAVVPGHSYENYCKKTLFSDAIYGGRPKIGAGTQVLGAFGGWEMTTADYATFIKRGFAIKAIADKAQQFMNESLTMDLKDNNGKTFHYGLGVALFATKKGRRLQHYGNWDGPGGSFQTTPLHFSSYFALYDNGEIIVAAAPDKSVIVGPAVPSSKFQLILENALHSASD